MLSLQRSLWCWSLPFFLTAFLLGMVLMSASKTSAHSASSWYPLEWPSSTTAFRLGQLDSPLNTSTAKNSIKAGEDPWNATSASHDFSNGSEDSSVTWTNSCLTTGYGNQVWIVSDNISWPGATYRCGGTYLTRVVIVLDDVGISWYTGSGSPGGSQYDLRSVMTHEFGHAGGFASHWSSSDADCSGSDAETMCVGNPPVGNVYERTLEIHEKHTYDDAY